MSSDFQFLHASKRDMSDFSYLVNYSCVIAAAWLHVSSVKLIFLPLLEKAGWEAGFHSSHLWSTAPSAKLNLTCNARPRHNAKTKSYCWLRKQRGEPWLQKSALLIFFFMFMCCLNTVHACIPKGEPRSVNGLDTPGKPCGVTTGQLISGGGWGMPRFIKRTGRFGVQSGALLSDLL